MPRLPELTMETADPAVQEWMAGEEGALGTILNPTKLMGHRPPIAQAQEVLRQSIDESDQIEPQLRYLVYTFVAGRNGCPF